MMGEGRLERRGRVVNGLGHQKLDFKSSLGRTKGWHTLEDPPKAQELTAINICGRRKRG